MGWGSCDEECTGERVCWNAEGERAAEDSGGIWDRVRWGVQGRLLVNSEG